MIEMAVATCNWLAGAQRSCPDLAAAERHREIRHDLAAVVDTWLELVDAPVEARDWPRELRNKHIAYDGQEVYAAEEIELDRLLPGLPTAQQAASVPIEGLLQGWLREVVLDPEKLKLPAARLHTFCTGWRSMGLKSHARWPLMTTACANSLNFSGKPGSPPAMPGMRSQSCSSSSGCRRTRCRKLGLAHHLEAA